MNSTDVFDALVALCALVPLTTGACASARGVPPAATEPLSRPEIRALWVDAFHAGIRSPAEADELIATAAWIAWRRQTERAQADGNGYFGFTHVKPGRYRVWVDDAVRRSKPVFVVVEAGRVSHAAP